MKNINKNNVHTGTAALKIIAFFALAAILFSACVQTKNDPGNEEGASNQFVLNNPACDFSQLTPTQMTDLKNYTKDLEMKLTPEKGDTIASIKTSKGELKVLLYTDNAPKTTENFIKLTEQGKYKDTPIHRVIDCFMVQTGDFENGNGTGGYSHNGPGTNLEDEFGDGLKHIRGALSMANTGFPNSGGSQFFIVQADHGTPWLDGKHAVFGFVYEGMDIIDEMAKSKKDGSDRPLEEIVMESIEIITK